jgi:hypothetical protein
MLTRPRPGGEHGHVSSVNGISPVGRAQRRLGTTTVAARLPRQIGFTKRRVIDLMRIGRTFCRR